MMVDTATGWCAECWAQETAIEGRRDEPVTGWAPRDSCAHPLHGATDAEWWANLGEDGRAPAGPMTLLECLDMAAEAGRTHCIYDGSDGWVPMPRAAVALAGDTSEQWRYRDDVDGCRCWLPDDEANGSLTEVQFRAGRPA